jgi:hypothetical protein
MRSSQKEGYDLRAPADIKSATSLGSIDLVPGQGEKIHPQPPDIEWYLPGSLDGVSMKRYTLRSGQFCDLWHGLYGAHVVIGQHYRDECSLVADRLTHGLGVYEAALIYWQIRDISASPLQRLTGVEYGRMFHRASDEMIFPAPALL